MATSASRSPRRRRGGADAPVLRATRRLGAARRAQLITTYGVGSMIAFENESFIVAGLDSWDVSEAPEIYERRLARTLNVRAFRLPPAPADPQRAIDGVRARRFPDYCSCPGCGVLQPHRLFNSPAKESKCRECEEKLVPSRFVVACAKGHLDDFPYWKWVHRGQDRGAVGVCGGQLNLSVNGATASLRSIVLSCGCGTVPEVSMEGAFRSSALRDLGITCRGTRPWLKNAPAESCSETPRTLQRGSSAAWFPAVRSAISIPPWGEGIHALLEQEKLIGAPEESVQWHFSQRPHLLKKVNADIEQILNVLRAINEEDTHAAEDVPAVQAHSALRREEYRMLRRGHPEKHGADLQQFVCEPPPGDHAPLAGTGLDSVMLVKRLREVRALKSFTRLQAATDDKGAPLTLSEDIDWLPAIEVSGEGVFLRLEEARLKEWEQHPAVVARAERIRRNHLHLLQARAAKDPKGPAPASPVTPRYLLLHTLAHVLINEWSLDAGYPAAALCERLYADDEMSGVLLYTATSDSEGSLGGIVAQGDPERLSRTLTSALHRAAWCSNDPLCMESEASGADSFNLAACHACVLLPETSCETNNSFLDRALLVSSPEAGIPGFFQEIH